MSFAGALAVIAANTVRELVRSKLLYNILVFTVLLIASSMLVAQLTIGQWDRVILDMGLAAIELAGVLVAVLIGVGIVAGEIERKTIFATLAKPVTRGAFLLGRYAGLLVILLVNVVIMMAVLTAVLKIADYQLTAVVVAAALLIFVELALLAAAAMFFGSFTTPVLATAFSLCFFLIGHLLADLRLYREKVAHNTLARFLTGVIYKVLPDLELLNLKSQASNGLPLPPGLTSTATAYGVVYGAILLLLAIGVFSRRDLK